MWTLGSYLFGVSTMHFILFGLEFQTKTSLQFFLINIFFMIILLLISLVSSSILDFYLIHIEWMCLRCVAFSSFMLLRLQSWSSGTRRSMICWRLHWMEEWRLPSSKLAVQKLKDPTFTGSLGRNWVLLLGWPSGIPSSSLSFMFRFPLLTIWIS